MKPLHLHSEKFASTGNLTGEGFRKLLGRPSLDLLQTVVREAIQNSMDATLPGEGARVLLRTRTLHQQEVAVLAGVILAELPPDEQWQEIQRVMNAGHIRILEIADFSTTGLAGPTRADIVTDGPEDPDFVNFMRNVGAPRDTFHGGGTYGYGKTSLYALSSHSTILVDSQTTHHARPVRRFMGCRLAGTFTARENGVERRFTGRHWWGRRDSDGELEPVEDEEAVEIAEALGFPERTPDKFGTTIAILAPELGPDIGAELLETVLWNFWPRMARTTDESRRLRIAIEIDHEEVDIPDPEDYPPLDLFARSLGDLRAGVGEAVTSRRPAKHLGKLSMCKGLRAARQAPSLRPESSIPSQASHIALMRPVELVVKYLEGEAFPDPDFEWAGVFVCDGDTEVEQAFADSEPPAHDDWSPGNLPKGRGKTFVNVALRTLREKAATFANPLTVAGSSEDRGPSLASTAARMGRLLDKGSARGPGRSRAGEGGPSPSRRVRVSSPSFSHLELDGERRIAVFEADLVNDGSLPEACILAKAHLVMDGAATSGEDIVGDFSGEILDMRVEGDPVEPGVTTLGNRSGRITCRVPVSDQAAVGLKLQISEGQQ